MNKKKDVDIEMVVITVLSTILQSMLAVYYLREIVTSVAVLVIIAPISAVIAFWAITKLLKTRNHYIRAVVIWNGCVMLSFVAYLIQGFPLSNIFGAIIVGVIVSHIAAVLKTKTANSPLFPFSSH